MKPAGLPVLSLDDSHDSHKVRVGDIAHATGNPLGVWQTVTAGVTSAEGRRVEDSLIGARALTTGPRTSLRRRRYSPSPSVALWCFSLLELASAAQRWHERYCEAGGTPPSTRAGGL